VATFTAAMTAGRLAGDRVAARLGPVTAFRSGALLAGIGFGAALLVGTPLAGLAGLGLLGGGLSLTFPLAVSAAGRSNGAAATAVARVSTLGYLGAFVGPGLIGAVAGPFGLPAALAVPAVLVTGAALAARLVAPPGPAPSPGRPAPPERRQGHQIQGPMSAGGTGAGVGPGASGQQR
jgi:MFS family permease